MEIWSGQICGVQKTPPFQIKNGDLPVYKCRNPTPSLLSHLPADLLSKPPWVLTWWEVRDLQLFVIVQSECLPSESMINLKWRGGGLLWFPNWGSNRWLHMIYLTTDCRLPHTLCLSPSLISLSFNLCISHFVFSPFYALPPYVQTRFVLFHLYSDAHTHDSQPPELLVVG